MPPPRVLLVDDSLVVRRLVAKALDRDGRVEVVGTSADGQAALEDIGNLSPDIVVLDVEMPVMDGLATLREIRKRWPRLPVIMFSTLTERGGRVTLDALALGASDYVTKPRGVDPRDSMALICDELVPRVFGLSGIPSPARTDRPIQPAPTEQLPPPGTVARPSGRRGRIDAVGIAVSTGGPNALSQLLPALPGDLPVPVLVVQHMPAMFTRLLAERLDARSALPVMEGSDGQIVSAPGVWIAPGDRHMTLERVSNGELKLHVYAGPHENSCRPSADPLFRSMADVLGPHALAVVLTGMGQDGLSGARKLSAAGSQIVAQDEASSVVWGMPGFVVHAGLASAVLPLDLMAPEITRRARERPAAVQAPLAT